MSAVATRPNDPMSEPNAPSPATRAAHVAAFGLLATIFGVHKARPAFTPVAVGLYITSAYWFTASTSFANPAVTLARSMTDTFAGVAPSSAPMFVAAQIAGALAAVTLFGWLLKEKPA